MPLTVHNLLTLTGSAKQIEMLHKSIIKAGLDYSLLELLFPNRRNDWGTKYPDTNHSDISIRTFEDQTSLGQFASTLSLSFETEETAPVKAFKLLSQKHPEMDICLDYKSLDFYGVAHYDGDWEALQHVVYDNDPTPRAVDFAEEVHDDDVATVIGILIRRFQMKNSLTGVTIMPTFDGFSVAGRLGYHTRETTAHADTLQGAFTKLIHTIKSEPEEE